MFIPNKNQIKDYIKIQKINQEILQESDKKTHKVEQMIIHLSLKVAKEKQMINLVQEKKILIKIGFKIKIIQTLKISKSLELKILVNIE